MPRPNLKRADAFDQSTPAPATVPGRVPYINAGEANRAIYEDGAASFPMSGFQDPVEKENEELKGQLSEVQEHREQLRQEAEQLREQLAAQSTGLTVQGGGLVVEGFQFSPTGLIPPDEITQESWEQVGLLLLRLEGSIQWLIGDWLAYGANFGYGDVKKLALEMGREPGTFWEYAYVCRSVQSWVRTQDLSYGHHKLVAPYTPEEQQEYLHYALYGEDKPLSVARFRAWINEQKGDASQPALPISGATAIPKPAFSALEKYDLRDLSTLKPKERATAVGYVTEMERWLADFKRRLGAE